MWITSDQQSLNAAMFALAAFSDAAAARIVVGVPG